MPQPFHFHQPKSTAKMRTHMDFENYMINPTAKKNYKRMRSVSPTATLKENPATTKKFNAYVDKRRREMEEKKQKEEMKFQDEVERFIKQNRLSQRVKCSPAIVSNAAELKKRKK